MCYACCARINPEPRATGASEGTSFADGACPQASELGEFSDNVAHSNGRYGLRIYSSAVFKPEDPVDKLKFPDGGWFPVADQCEAPSPSNPYLESKLSRLLSYRNKANGVQVSRVAGLVMDGFQIVENKQRGFEMPGGQGGILVGPWGANRIDNALIVASLDGVDHGRVGIETACWDRLSVNNPTFCNFATTGAAVIGFAKQKFAKRDGGWETRFANVTWHNSPRRVAWRHVHEGVFVDLDGSFTGTGGPAQLVPFTPFLANTRTFPECELDPHSVYLTWKKNGAENVCPPIERDFYLVPPPRPLSHVPTRGCRRSLSRKPQTSTTATAFCAVACALPAW
jgi:hypothetical protein